MIFLCRFIEGDDFHPAENKEQMKQGIPLTDELRLGWLNSLNAEIKQSIESNTDAVISCSALKDYYRSILTSNLGEMSSQGKVLVLDCD